MTKPLKTLHNFPAIRMIENHAPRAVAARRKGHPPFHPGHARARFDPRGGHPAQVSLPRAVTPYRFSGLAQKSARCWGVANGVGGMMIPALSVGPAWAKTDRGVRV
jgi:hypothetical protein